jgi:hypothetical protein
MKQLCCLTLKQQSIINNRKKLHEYADKLIFILESNIGIVAAVGLQVFGFQHLSFQEYFVSQFFVKDSSIEKVIKCIVTFILNPRFREPLVLSISWISWRWSFNDYDQFCNLLVSSNKNYVIPIEILLLFDTFDDIQRLPSNMIIFTALNNLLDHPFDIVALSYLMPNLFKLDEDTIIEWMQLHLTEEKRLTTFCRCLLSAFYHNTRQIDSDSILTVIYKQIWSLNNISTSGNFVIDQSFRKIMNLEKAPGDAFNHKLSSYFLSHNIYTSNIHPLILSVIVAVCGGMSFEEEKEERMMEIHFSTKKMHRESSVLPPIIEYFANNKESHSIKVETLIKEYENVLQESSQSDVSVDIVDTFIALICLQGLSEPLIYQKYDGYQALPLALNRLKQSWFYLKQPLNRIPDKYLIIDKSSITSEVEVIINVFLSQPVQSDEDHLAFSLACAAALNKLCIEWSSDLFESNSFPSNNIGRYLGCQPEFGHSIKVKVDQMAKGIFPLKMFQYEPYFLIICVPQSLQKLYYCMITDPTNNTNSLLLVVLLSQCLIFLEDVDKVYLNFSLTLSILQSQFKEHMLENYASALKYSISECQSKDWEMLINVERQRIYNAKNTVQNQDKELRLFTASISLARLFQVRYHSDSNRATRHIHLSTAESEEVYFSVINILDPILQIIALSIILDMKNPVIFDEGQTNELLMKMISQLQSLLPRLSLLMATLLFIRCHTARQFFLEPFKQMASIIEEKLKENSVGEHSEDQTAAFIALQKLNNFDLSRCLSEFAKQTKNLSDLLNFNSTIFLRYFTQVTSFDKSNTILLSALYLIELAFDSQILQIYTNSNHKNEILLLKNLNVLLNKSVRNEKIMTIKVATWITQYFQNPNKRDLEKILKNISVCSIIEKGALPIMEKWLNYRMDRDLRYFAHYAALQLTIEGSNIPDLIDIINELLDIDKEFRFISLVERLFKSELVDLITLRRILIILNQNVRYSLKIHVWIDRKEIFELILKLELERIALNMHRLHNTSVKPFLLMINGCSEDLQFYLVEHLRTFTNTQNEIENPFKEEYIAVVVKWIIKNNTTINLTKEFCEFIFTFIYDQRFPQVQKIIINSLNSVFIRSYNISKERLFLQNDAIIHLEKIISFCNTYTEDVLAICLLAYGNCLLKLQKLETNRNVSNEIQCLLTNLFETSLSKIISIRAAFCLIFVQQSIVKFNSILNFFTNKWNLTPEKKYNILLQQLFYEWGDHLINKGLKEREIINHLKTHFAELVDIFVIDLYNYLRNKDNRNYSPDPLFDYGYIALELLQENSSMFVNAVRKSSFGEDKFKQELYLCLYHMYERSYNTLYRIYSAFGVITIEFIEMLTWIDEDNNQTDSIWNNLKDIKQVSNREVIEKLFQLLNSIVYDTRFNLFLCVLQLLVNLAKVHVVSSFEIHQRISFISNHFSYDNKFTDWYRKKNIYFLLMQLSCLKNIRESEYKVELFTQCNINKEFDEKIENLEKKSNLFLRRNFFFTVFRLVSNSSN